MLRVDPAGVTANDLAPAVEALRRGQIVAFPTDTFYGLAVDPSSERVVHVLFALKGRAPAAAIPLVAGSLAQVERWCTLSRSSRTLASTFWPGPLSLICDAPDAVVTAVHGGRRTVAVRVPDHPVARALTDAFGAPLTATSANPSGAPPASRALDVPWNRDDMVLIVDGGQTPGGAPSTIVDARGGTPVLIRDGAVAWNRVLHSLQR
jgi:L-threonylcarbamoyladenylate synthase